MMAHRFSFSSSILYTEQAAQFRLRERQNVQERLERIRQLQEGYRGPGYHVRSEGEGEENGQPPQMAKEEPATDPLPKMDEMRMRSACSPGPVRWAYKNLYGASIAFMLVLSAFIGIQNLQSSINAQLGVASLSIIYVFYLLVGFVTPAIVRLLGTKYSLLFGFICHIIYIATNFYPEYYTLVPSSILLGIGSGPVWAGVSTHLATTAITLAPHVMESINVLISKFTGTFFFIFQLTQILGNVASSLILFPYDGTNTTNSDSDICDNTDAQDISDVSKFALVSTYVVYDIAGIAVLLIFVDKLPKESMFEETATNKTKLYCTGPFTDVIKVLFSWRMLLLGPLSLYNGMELSFAFGSFTQVCHADVVIHIYIHTH